MPRHLTLTLATRQVSCRVQLLDDLAPATCAAVWDALPLAGDAYHAKFARNEVYALLPRITAAPRRENPTVTPIPGDVCLFDFEPWEIGHPAYGYEPGTTAHAAGSQGGATDLALFYDRNNLLLNGDVGWVPGNVFGTVVAGLAAMAVACNDLWRNGFAGERLVFERE